MSNNERSISAIACIIDSNKKVTNKDVQTLKVMKEVLKEEKKICTYKGFKEIGAISRMNG